MVLMVTTRQRDVPADTRKPDPVAEVSRRASTSNVAYWTVRRYAGRGASNDEKQRADPGNRADRRVRGKRPIPCGTRRRHGRGRPAGGGGRRAAAFQDRHHPGAPGRG